MTDSIIGRWKIQALRLFNDRYEQIWVEAPAILADKDHIDSDKKMLQMDILFTEDGFIKMLMPVPEDIPPEEITAAVQSGELTLYDEKTMLLHAFPYRYDNGKLLYDTGFGGSGGRRRSSRVRPGTSRATWRNTPSWRRAPIPARF